MSSEDAIPANQELVELVIETAGTGWTPEYRQHLAERFAQIQKDTGEVVAHNIIEVNFLLRSTSPPPQPE